MNEQDIPIDIHTNKLLEWLHSRRHISKEWQKPILTIREHINAAIQDMPEHRDIITLLSGQHINYFHCIRIVEILKETEADSRNLFGRYGSQRMKDWQEILRLYERENVYLAEAAQLLIRNVVYEIPSLRKQLIKLEQISQECDKKMKGYIKAEQSARKEFTHLCEQLGIKGSAIRAELLNLRTELPNIFNASLAQLRKLEQPIRLYEQFVTFNSNGKHQGELLPMLNYVIKRGNTTVFEYKYGREPSKIVEDNIECVEEEAPVADDEIDWGIELEAPSSDESGFEIVDITTLDESSGIVVEHTDDTAKGDEALSVLDYPRTRNKLLDCVMELNAFVRMRIFEMKNESDDILALCQSADAPDLLQIQTLETVTELDDLVNQVLVDFMNKRTMHLHNIKHSPNYVDILTSNLEQKLAVAAKMKALADVNGQIISEYRAQMRKTEQLIQQNIMQTKELQKLIEKDISAKYKQRVVNIIGGVQML